MAEIINFNEKHIEKNKLLKEADDLTNDLMDYLPKERISRFLVYYECLNYLYRKDICEDWKTKVDCYLGIPDHIENFKDIANVNFKKFPLLPIFNIGLKSVVTFNFCLLRKVCWENITIGDGGHLMHFSNHDFVNYEIEFSERIENKEVNASKHFFDDETSTFYMENENLEQKLLDDPLEHAYYYKETLLNEYHHEKIKDLETNFFKTTLRFYLDFCTGRDFTTLGSLSTEEKQQFFSDFEDMNLKEFYEFIKELEDPHINYLCHTFKSFLSVLHDYYSFLYDLLEEGPNDAIEGDIEII